MKLYLILLLVMMGCNAPIIQEKKTIPENYTLQKAKWGEENSFYLTSTKFWVDCKPTEDSKFLWDEIGKIEGVRIATSDWRGVAIILSGEYEDYESEIRKAIDSSDKCWINK